MKAFGLLALIAAATSLAAPAPTSTLTAPLESTQFLSAPTIHSSPVSSPGRILATRAVTRDGSIPPNLYRFGVSFSEYCSHGTLQARGWTGNGQTRFALPFFTDPTQKLRIRLHPGRDLVFGPYSYEQHAFGLEYDGCVWTSEGGWPCGWCETKSWTLGPLDCKTGVPGIQRLTYRTCHFVDAHMQRLGGRSAGSGIREPGGEALEAFAAQDEQEDAPPPVNVTLDVGIAAPVHDDKSHSGSAHRYYWFNFSFSEYCDNGRLAARGWWYDGLGKYHVMLDTNTWTQLRLHPPMPYVVNVLILGPYNITEHSLGFEYNGCKFDSKGGGSCGFCHPRPWTTGPLNCDTGAPGPQRVSNTEYLAANEPTC